MLSTVTSLNSAADSPRLWRSAVSGAPGPTASSDRPGLDHVAQHFLQRGPSIRSVADLVNDPTSRSFLQQALGLGQDEQQNAQAQAELISAMLSFHEFQIPSRLQQFIELYNAKGPSSAPAQPSGADAEMHGPILPPQTAPLSDALLEHLQSWKIGGL